MSSRTLLGLLVPALLVIGPAQSAVHSDPPADRSTGDPVAQSVILEGRLTTSTSLAIHYVIAGNTAVYSSTTTGDPLLADGGELGSVRVFVDGRLRGGSDAGSVTCAADTRVREYYDQFSTQTFRVRASTQHRVRVVTRYCAPDGKESATTQQIVIR